MQKKKKKMCFSRLKFQKVCLHTFGKASHIAKLSQSERALLKVMKIVGRKIGTTNSINHVPSMNFDKILAPPYCF